MALWLGHPFMHGGKDSTSFGRRPESSELDPPPLPRSPPSFFFFFFATFAMISASWVGQIASDPNQPFVALLSVLGFLCLVAW